MTIEVALRPREVSNVVSISGINIIVLLTITRGKLLSVPQQESPSEASNQMNFLAFTNQQLRKLQFSNLNF